MVIQNFRNIYKCLNTKFPISDCTIKNLKEKSIYDSNRQYLCMIIDKRFNNEVNLKIMKPYIWIGDETNIEEFKGQTGYGWVDRDGNYVDNFENPIHGDIDDWFVIGFIEYRNNDDEELWNKLE